MVSCDNLILLCATIETKLYNIVCTQWPFFVIIGGKTERSSFLTTNFEKEGISHLFIQKVNLDQINLFTISTLDLFFSQPHKL